jgi:hypothetical protein
MVQQSRAETAPLNLIGVALMPTSSRNEESFLLSQHPSYPEIAAYE